VLLGLAAQLSELLAGVRWSASASAAYVAIAPALLADCFPVSGRAARLLVLNMAIPVGSALGIVLGGLIGASLRLARGVFRGRLHRRHGRVAGGGAVRSHAADPGRHRGHRHRRRLRRSHRHEKRPRAAK